MFLTLYIAHTELFFVIDDFFLRFEATYLKFLKQSGRCLRIRPSELSISEIIFIVVWYKCSNFTHFKAFFLWLKNDRYHLFKSLPCYQRMIHLINAHQLALHALHFALMRNHQSSFYGLIQPLYLFVKIKEYNVISPYLR